MCQKRGNEHAEATRINPEEGRGKGLSATTTTHFNNSICILSIGTSFGCPLEGVASVAMPLPNDASECQFLLPFWEAFNDNDETC